MNRFATRRSLLVCSMIAAIMIAAMAPTPSANGQNAPTEKVIVEQTLRSFFDAARKKEWPRIDAMLAPDFHFYSDSALVLDKPGFMTAMMDDSMDIDQLDLKDVSVLLSNQDNVALVTYRAELKSAIKGRPYNMMSVETVVFRKDDQSWRMVHNHASIKTE
jgi:ketosteroid isomerase-like protein